MKFNLGLCGFFRPIHCAVIENNPDYVRRHCVALKFKGVSINTTNINNLVRVLL